MYVGLEIPKLRLDHGKEKEKKIKIREVVGVLLMVVAARIYGKIVRALIDSGITRCFITWPA